MEKSTLQIKKETADQRAEKEGGAFAVFALNGSLFVQPAECTSRNIAEGCELIYTSKKVVLPETPRQFEHRIARGLKIKAVDKAHARAFWVEFTHPEIEGVLYYGCKGHGQGTWIVDSEGNRRGLENFRCPMPEGVELGNIPYLRWTKKCFE